MSPLTYQHWFRRGRRPWLGGALMATVLELPIVVCSGPQTSRIVLPSARPDALTLAPGQVKTVAGASATTDGDTLIVPENRAKAHAQVIALI